MPSKATVHKYNSASLLHARKSTAIMYLPPFCALIQSSEQLEKRLTGDLKHILAADLMNLSQGGNSICNYHRIAVGKQILQNGNTD